VTEVIAPMAPNALAQRARAIKERCYAAWHSDPAEALRCAAEIAALADQSLGSEAAPEVQALAHWTAAIAAIVNGELPGAIGHLDRAREAFERLQLGADAAQVQIPRIMVLSMLGQFEQASDCAQATRDALLAQGDLRSAARVVLNMGSLCYSQDRYAEAARHYREASLWFARVGDREHSVLADLGRGDACSFLGDLDEAEALYRRAAQRASAHGLHVILCSATQALAELEFVRGNYRAALNGLETAIRTFTRMQLPLLRMQAEKALADTYAELNLFEEAGALYAEVEALVEDDPSTHAWLCVHRARLAAMQGRPGDALGALARAQAWFDSSDNSVGAAEVSLARATLAMRAGLWQQAFDCAAQARRCLEALGLPGEHALLAMAAAEVRTGALDHALAHLRQLLESASTPLPVRERSWLWQGRALLAEGRRQQARAAFESAVELAELGLTLLPGDDVQRGYLDARAGAYEELLRLELAATGRADDAVAVLMALERLRARTLSLQLAVGRTPSAALAGNPDLQAERERLDWIYRRSNRHLRESGDEAVSPGLERERQALETRILERQRRARLAQAPHPGAGGTPATDWQRLGTTLQAGQALVAYAQLDGEVFAISLHAGEYRLHRELARQDALDAAVRALRLQLETQRLGAATLSRHGELLERRVRLCLGRLHDMLWRPLEDALQGVQALRIVPTAAVAALPFAAFWDGTRYLVERFDISLLASVAAAFDAPQPPQVEKVLLMADTARLDGSRSELEALARIWPSALVLGGPEMTREALREQAPAAELLHIACHGEFRADSPLFSALLLGDGAFTAMEIEQMRLRRHPVVILSACDTALADAARGDEALGLVRSFLVAGASRVIAGLWQVDDAGTAQWMERLHREIRQHAGTVQTVKLAAQMARVQRGYIAEGVHVWHWAGFVLHGGN